MRSLKRKPAIEYIIWHGNASIMFFIPKKNLSEKPSMLCHKILSIYCYKNIKECISLPVQPEEIKHTTGAGN